MSRPGRTVPPGKTRYPLYIWLGGTQGRSGQVRKISPPLGLDPRTVQPVGSRYTDYVTQPQVAVTSQIINVNIEVFCVVTSCLWVNNDIRQNRDVFIFRVKQSGLLGPLDSEDENTTNL